MRVQVAFAFALATMFAMGNFSNAQQPAITVQADHVLHPISRTLTGACIEDVNHEVYGGIFSQMIYGESFQEPPKDKKSGSPAVGISAMWGPVVRGGASGRFEIAREHPFAGSQSQRVTFESGHAEADGRARGEVGIENEGLNRWGMNLVADKNYEGLVWVRTDKPLKFFAALESRDGSKTYAEQSLETTAGADWQRLKFTLAPTASDPAGRFTLKLKRPGTATFGYVMLQPGPWGRFKGLPVRRDIAEGLIHEGITLLRYGGSMVNSPNYRWKNMQGEPDLRPPYAGTWHRYSSNGWAIPEFMDFCEAAGFEYAPDFNIDETPDDMADFIEFAKAPADSAGGRKRAALGHPAPYQLHYIELGNEERVDEKYADRFEAIATAIWAKDPQVVLVVGDFAYDKPIHDPFKFDGAASRITTLAAHQRILRFARQHNCEVAFDVHLWTDHPERVNHSLVGMISFADALDKIADGAKHKVVVFEYNSGNCAVKRALANALTTLAIEHDGRVPIACVANCLQPDGQNDNNWNQGMLFLNPTRVWLSPPGCLTQMLSTTYEPQLVECDVAAAAEFDAVAARSADGRTLVLTVVNAGDKDMPLRIKLAGFTPQRPAARAVELSGPMDAVNTADKPDAVAPHASDWPHEFKSGGAVRSFPAHSVTTLQFE